MKRLISFALAIVLVSGLFATAPIKAFATEDVTEQTTTATENTTEETTEDTTGDATEDEKEEPKEEGFTTSSECITLLKQHEGFCRYPVWDYAQYTVGYGTRCPDDMLYYYREHGITEEEAETLLRNFLDYFEKEINNFAKKRNLELTQNQFDALLSFSYNCGTAWMTQTTGTFYNAIVNGATQNDLVRAFALWCSANDEVLLPLLRRRLCEANMYLNGVYSQQLPPQYCYVLYNANGGITSPRTQGYSTEWEVKPFPVPEREGYTFVGWYTERVGGTKVEKLETTHNGTTLYAHWVDPEGNPPEQITGTVTVTVTGVDVNVRKGPGTNYTKVSTATKGDKLVITDTVDAGGHTWGKFDKGWIALTYTDYDVVIHQKPAPDAGEQDKPTDTPVEPEEPEAPTEPAEPEEPTEPEEPVQPEEPEVPETTKVMGTVNVKEFLRVRKGAGTGYEEVCRLKPKQRVEILEQKMVGATKWGRITEGWISLDYVILDKTEDKEDTNNSGSNNGNVGGNTGADSNVIHTGTIVNCTQLRIRKGPGVNYEIAGYINRDTKVSFTELKQVGNVTWGKISQGWISLDYVKLDATGSGSAGQKLTGTANVQQFLRIRATPSTSAAVTGYLKPNERVEILEQRTLGSTVWGKISKGWVSMAYIVLDKTEEKEEDNTDNAGGSDNTENSGSATTSVFGKVNVNDYLNIRTGPGTNYQLAGTYTPNVRVEILERKTVNVMSWGKTDRGWVCMNYIILETGSSETEKDYRVVTGDLLHVRKGAGTKNTIVAYLYYGAKVEVLETTTVQGVPWGRIAEGWICLNYTKKA